ncbi:MAG TPA: carboxypeptidase M32 [Herpetosiphonaceae bacterium]
MDALEDLKAHLREVNDLRSAAALLDWDQSTYMPPGGAAARGRQTATLSRIAHERATDPALGRLLDSAAKAVGDDPDSDAARLVAAARHDYDRNTRVPAEFVGRLTNHLATTYEAWTRARPANDFAGMVPALERTLELSRQYAEFFPEREHIADPLIAESDFGMATATVKALFAELRQELVPIVQAVTAQPVADDSCLRQFFPREQQWQFGVDVIRRYGYDFERGRQDVSPHPFMTKFSLGDVRITTRVDEHDLSSCLFSTLHESGHAMYEQGINQEFEGLPLGQGASSGVHESQSRLWENLVGRSRPFWSHFYPKLQAVFPEQLGKVELDTFYRAVNKVERTLVRTEADELTYNLHVILRFEFELDLLEGRLAVRDLAEAWRERIKADLGVSPPDDRDGALQDVHWFGGPIGGAFQGYTLGNILSAQFYEQALSENPAIPGEIARGEFGALHGWLGDKLYRHGRKFSMDELVRRITGGPLSIKPYIRYLRGKYGELYQLPA